MALGFFWSASDAMRSIVFDLKGGENSLGIFVGLFAYKTPDAIPSDTADCADSII